MLYILIPCILLLIVAVVLKKRESANNESASSENTKKTSAKKANKNASSRSSRASNTQTKVAAAPVATETAQTSLDSEVRSSIESLIKAENYFAAEAKINQALNQDSSQHELYLYLLEIHVAQKDDFAIKQLINYLRSLGLHDIADQAEAKQLRTQSSQELTAAQSSQALHGSAAVAAPIANDQALKSDAAFDELISSPNSHNAPTTAFDSLQSDFTETQAEKKDLAPIEYSFEPKKPVEEAKPLDFDLNASAATSDFTPPAVEVTAPVNEPSTAPEVAPLEFNFSTPAQAEEKEVAPAEDFIFTEATPTAAKTEPSATEFKLDTDLPIASTDFHFSLDTPISADPSSLAFETQKIEIAPTATPEVESADLVNANDPLAQSFPELLKVSEIQLNLDLATRYIELGAYDSAKKLLVTNEENFSVEQRERSQKLLKQIAS